MQNSTDENSMPNNPKELYPLEKEESASTAILYYFADTNLFLQCLPLEEIDWSPWNTFEEIRLIVSGPVLREIDYLKNKGNNRANRRARFVSAMLRNLLDNKHKVVLENSPRVILSIEPNHIYSQDLKGRLNYQERDDQLVGTVYEFVQRNPTLEVRLLSHDTMPLFTANGLGLKTDNIPENWLLPPETTQSEKKLVRLSAEIERLKKVEPSVSVSCLGQSDTKTDRYNASFTCFEPLIDTEVDQLMRCLQEHFPLETDFRSKRVGQTRRTIYYWEPHP